MDEAVSISVVIPAYNEAATIAEVVRRVLNCGYDVEVVIVDDASTDGTRDALKQIADPRVRCFYHAVNRGKGAALRMGFAAARKPIVIVQDADLEYDPRDYGRVLEPIIDGRADMVYGSRFLGGPHRVLYFWHSVGNTLLTIFSNMLTNLNLTDMETCYKAVRGDLARSLLLTSDRFGFEPEITARLAQRDARIYEVPISYAGRTYAEGKKISWRDGAAALWHIIKFNLVR